MHVKARVCVEGEAGAPVLESEAATLKAIFPK